MLQIGNLNNLNQYLKKTEAEEIYMKKINSMDMRFTSLITSLSTKFNYYDDQIHNLGTNMMQLNSSVSSLSGDLTGLESLVNSLSSSVSSNSANINSLSGSIGSLNNSMGSLSNSVISLNNSIGSISGSYGLFTNSVNNKFNSVDSEISNLWDAISSNNNYNFFKEFAKPTQFTYKNMDNEHVIIDDEQFEYLQSKPSNFTMLNPNKLEYCFASNVYTTNSSSYLINLGGEYSRLGFRIPSDDNPQNYFNATASSVYLYQDGNKDFNTNNYLKCLKAYICNDNNSHNINYISTNLNAQMIDLANYTRSNNNVFTTLWLNDRVDTLSGFYGMEKVYLDIRRPVTHTNPLYITGYYPQSVALSFSYHGPTEYGYHFGAISQPKLATVTLYQPENLNWTINSMTIYASTTNAAQSYTLTHDLAMQPRYSLNINLSPGVSLELPDGFTRNQFSYSISNGHNNNSYQISKWNISRFCLSNASAINAQNNSMSVFNIINYSSAPLNTLTFLNNNITSMTISGYHNNMLNFNNNTVAYMTVTQSVSNVGISFGANFRNSSLSIISPVANTYYSYNNPDATLKVTNGKAKFDYFTAGTCNCTGGPGFEVAVFTQLNVSAGLTHDYNNGGWKYVWCNSFGLTGADTFYSCMMSQDQAFFHCPFIQLGTSCLNYAINRGNSVLSHQNVLVDNAPTTSVDLHLFGNHTSESVHPEFIHDQQYIVSVDIRGWHPSRIIGFDQYYMFKNVASGYSAVPDQKFTAHVDNVNDWNAYKGFFDPFNDGQGENRVVFVQG